MANNQQNPLYAILGALSLVADFFGIFAFVSGGTITQFWTAHWVVELGIIIILLAVALWLISISHQPIVTGFLPTVAIIYGILFCITFAAGFYYLSAGEINGMGDFIGFIVLTLFPSCMSMIIASTCNNHGCLKPVSYCVVTVGLLCFLGLLTKYVFFHSEIQKGILAGEIVLLVYVSFCHI